MMLRTTLLLAIACASPGTTLAETASPDEVTAALRTFYPGVVAPGPVPMNADFFGAIIQGLDGKWYRPDILGSVDPEKVGTACSRLPTHITTALYEITLIQESKPAPVTLRYTYVSGNLFSEWIDIPALFARLAFDQIPDEEKRRQMELNVLRANGGFVVIVRPSANVLWMYSLAGGPRLYARCE
jgi:hypothetical protein